MYVDFEKADDYKFLRNLYKKLNFIFVMKKF